MFNMNIYINLMYSGRIGAQYRFSLELNIHIIHCLIFIQYSISSAPRICVTDSPVMMKEPLPGCGVASQESITSISYRQKSRQKVTNFEKILVTFNRFSFLPTFFQPNRNKKFRNFHRDRHVWGIEIVFFQKTGPPGIYT